MIRCIRKNLQFPIFYALGLQCLLFAIASPEDRDLVGGRRSGSVITRHDVQQYCRKELA